MANNDFKLQIETLFENHQTKEFIQNYTNIIPENNINRCFISVKFDDENDKEQFFLVYRRI